VLGYVCAGSATQRLGPLAPQGAKLCRQTWNAQLRLIAVMVALIIIGLCAAFGDTSVGPPKLIQIVFRLPITPR
jgi:hypothetical protein